METTLYERLGGYDAIAAVATSLLGRLHADAVLGRFWQNRGTDGLAREKQLLIDFLVNATGGPLHYSGRELRMSHEGMGITPDDWARLVGHLRNTAAGFSVPDQERDDFLAYVETLYGDLVGV